MPTEQKILPLNQAVSTIENWKSDGHSIVFSNGCFDILHLGHIDYLEKARGKGDKLVIGLNSDASVKIIKGEERPINNNEFRSRMLSALEFVDLVIFFDDETPLKLIESVQPDVLVKGDDYLTADIVGADFVLQNGGKVETVELVEGYSTTSFIERIKSI